MEDSMETVAENNKLSGIVGGCALVTGWVGRQIATHPALPLPLRLPIAVATGYTALVGLAVAGAATSMVNDTAFLKKRPDGSLDPLSELAFFPYHLALRTWTKLKRAVTGEPVCSLVAPGWYLGGWPACVDDLPRTTTRLAVVDVTCELPRRHAVGPYHLLPTWDMHGPDADALDDAAEFALAQKRSGKAVLVHCAHGHGRSATVLCAALCLGGTAPSWEAAEAMLVRARPRVKLNAAQRKALTLWAWRRKLVR